MNDTGSVFCSSLGGVEIGGSIYNSTFGSRAGALVVGKKNIMSMVYHLMMGLVNLYVN